MKSAVLDLQMPRGPKRKDVTAKIDADIHLKARMIATFRGITVAEYLSDLLRKPVDADYEKLKRQMAAGDKA